MKKILLAAIISLFFISCKKDNTISSINITGNWEYRGTTCYCTPPTDTNAYKPGNGTIYSFSTTTYKYYLKRVLKKSGSYKVTKETVNGGLLDRIIFDNNTSADAIYVRLTGNKFSLGGSIGSAADAPEDFYEKLLTSPIDIIKISN